MLSAICLVNYFEGGELPKDRAMLYRLCVEGLLNHWDHRRGIRSEYSLDEKLRVSREVAISMQKDDRAEYESEKVLKVFSEVLKNKDRAKKLLEHIRYRTGLLIERRAGVFAFAHLTFQEYLAARSVYESNRLKVDVDYLAREHADGRWNEVIALYCGLASSKSARQMIELLISQPATTALANVLAEAFLSSMSELSEDKRLRERVVRQIAVCPIPAASQLERFAIGDVVKTANFCVGRANNPFNLSGAYAWLRNQPAKIDHVQLARRLEGWRSLNSNQKCELIYLIHAHGSDRVLGKVASDPQLYAAAGPEFDSRQMYVSQAEIALRAFYIRFADYDQTGVGTDKAFLEILRVITQQKNLGTPWFFNASRLFYKNGSLKRPFEKTTWPEFIMLARKFAAQLGGEKNEDAVVLETWADQLENEMQLRRRKNNTRQSSKPPKRATAVKSPIKKSSKRNRKR